MIEVKWNNRLNWYDVRDGERTAFGLRLEDTTWALYDPRRPDKPAVFTFPLDGIFFPPEESAEQRERELQRLEGWWRNDESFRRLLDFVGQIIQSAYADEADGRHGEVGWVLVARGAKLCRLFLDFLDPKLNPTRSQRYHTTRLVLQRAYYFGLAYLYEAQNEIEKQPEDSLIALYLDGWDLLREYRATLRIWHSTILREENSWLFRDVLGRDREEEMWSVLVREDHDQQLRRFFTEEAGREFVEYLIDRWFLPRYDLKRAQILQYTVERSSNGADTPIRIKPPPWWRRCWPWGGIVLGVAFFVLSLPFESLRWEQAQTAAPLLVAGALLFLLIIGVTGFRRPRWLRFQLPNLLAAVFIGYFPLLLADEPWTFALRLSDAGLMCVPQLLQGATVFLGFATVVGSLSFVYLLARVRTVDVPEVVARKRACSIFLRGLSYSFLVGIVALDVMGSRQFDLSSGRQMRGPFILVEELAGLTGRIHPSVVWVFMWLALFVGLFVQVLWEERPITEPWQ